MAQSGFSAVVIDADLRRPSQHTIFGVRNELGLTHLLTHPEQHWKSAAVHVAGELLYLIPSGPLPPNPADLLSSERFRSLVTDLGQEVDIVVIDTPPVLAVSDPLVVCGATNGVVLVARAKATRTDALARAAALFPDTVRLIGVVVDQHKGRGAGSYYYGYYGSSGGVIPPGPPHQERSGNVGPRSVADVDFGRPSPRPQR
jgi:non-specific protein-tyrosine kinase